MLLVSYLICKNGNRNREQYIRNILVRLVKKSVNISLLPESSAVVLAIGGDIVCDYCAYHSGMWGNCGVLPRRKTP